MSSSENEINPVVPARRRHAERDPKPNRLAGPYGARLHLAQPIEAKPQGALVSAGWRARVPFKDVTTWAHRCEPVKRERNSWICASQSTSFAIPRRLRSVM